MTASSPIVLIAGGSRGIGAAAAKLAGQRGFDVAVNYVSDAKAAAEVVAAIKATGRRAIAVQGDMGREEDVTRFFATAQSELGTPTHLVYNCGITGPNSRVEAVETKTLREVFDTNVLGALYCIRAAIPLMSKKHGGKGGSIVLLSSAAATLGGPGEYVWYAASKGAIDSMTFGLSKELAGDEIRVNAVAPGLIDTELHEPGRVQRVVSAVPFGRPGTAEEVAEGIVFLLSDPASYVSGTILRVSGAR
jgi:NAD(P)-dependent dehydrogenase (short-subunit alcohol dehydrogenase family)